VADAENQTVDQQILALVRQNQQLLNQLLNAGLTLACDLRNANAKLDTLIASNVKDADLLASLTKQLVQSQAALDAATTKNEGK